MRQLYRLRKQECVCFVLLLFLTLAVFWLNWAIGASIASPGHLAHELQSPPNSPQEWGIQTWIPMKYRVLFYWIVKGTWSTLFPQSGAIGFYGVFIFWSILLFYASLIAFYFFLRTLDFSRSTSFVGCLLFLASPPVTLAYLHVHTREDPLAYFLVVLAMVAVFKSKVVLVSLISILASLTRETTLIVPLVYLLVSGDSLRRRFLVFAPPVLSTLVLRILLGFVAYNPFFGSIRNIEYPVETVCFLFMTFGVLWLPSFIRLRDMRKQECSPSYAWRVLISSAPVALVLVMGTHVTLARAIENRISFLLFPWIIPLALHWFRANTGRIRTLAASRFYQAFAFFIFTFLSVALIYIQVDKPAFMWHFGAFYNRYWLLLGYVHLLITLTMIVPLWLVTSISRLRKLCVGGI